MIRRRPIRRPSIIPQPRKQRLPLQQTRAQLRHLRQITRHHPRYQHPLHAKEPMHRHQHQRQRLLLQKVHRIQPSSLCTTTKAVLTMTLRTSSPSMLRSHPPRCRNTRSLSAPAPTTCGHPVTGITHHKAITGYRAFGCFLPTSAHSGRRVSGAFSRIAICGITAIGDRISATTAASTTAAATLAMAMRAAIGTMALSTITALLHG